jgi:leucyl aminopeptidase
VVDGAVSRYTASFIPDCRRQEAAVFKSIRVATGRSPLTVVAVYADDENLPRGLKLETAQRNALKDRIKTPGFKAEPGETLPAGDDLLLVGLGKKDDLKPATLRTVGARLIRALDRIAPKAVRLFIGEAIPAKITDATTAGRCLAEGMGLANWRVDFFQGKASKIEDAHPALSITAEDGDFKKGLTEGIALADATNEARRIAATPPNICNPPWIASECRKLARKTGLTCRVISYDEAKKRGMGGIVNVGKASAAKPCLVILEHKPEKTKSNARLALVGKTITYDTGGYSLKINNSMKGMKYDKNGGCAVIGAMLAIAALNLPVHVVALLPAAENMVSGEAYRPDDIIEMYNGVSVEVTNTDAEGRLVLADALAYATDKLRPTAVIDAATLTGGVVVALGEWSAGVWCNDDDLLGRVQDAADVTGERVWRLPLWDDHREFMRSKHADIWNSGPKRDGHPIQGAAFLSYFIANDVPWAHIDIAGVSAVDSDRDLYCAGPTGYGVRLMAEVARSFA